MKDKIKEQFKKDIKYLKKTGQMIEKRMPVATAIGKSVFIIIK